MTTRVRAGALAAALLSVPLALAGCSSSEVDERLDEIGDAISEAPDVSTDRVRSWAYSDLTWCLIDGSPWWLDLDHLADDHELRYETVVAGQNAPTPSAWTADGSAIMEFKEVDGLLLWDFVTQDVNFTMTTPTETGDMFAESTIVEEQNGEFSVVGDHWFMVQFAEALFHSDVTHTVVPGDGPFSGDQADAFLPTLGRPFFEWSDAIAGDNVTKTWTGDFSCSADELVIRSSSGGYSYFFDPSDT